jgi:mycothiol system anti-sigma-R factor
VKQRCRETLERVYLFLDGEGLTEAERIEIEEHLEDCPPCFDRYGVEIEVKTIVARLRGAHRCPDALRSRIAALLQKD